MDKAKQNHKVRRSIEQVLWTVRPLMSTDASTVLASRILQAFHDAGGVMLAENQTLPENFYSISSDLHMGFSSGERCMYRAGFKRVEPLFEANPVST